MKLKSYIVRLVVGGCLACCSGFGAETAFAQSPRYDAVISNIFGRQALVPSSDLSGDRLVSFQELWTSVLALRPTSATTVVQTEESLWRIRGLMNSEQGKMLLTLYSKYLEGKSAAALGYFEQEIDELFGSPSLDASSRLQVYAAMLPLLERHALGSGDIVQFKKLQSTAQTLQTHGYESEQSIRCTFVADETTVSWIQFSFEQWASQQSFEASYGVSDVLPSGEVSLYCELVAQDGANAQSHASHSLIHAIDALHQSLISRDQDAIDASGNALLLTMNHTRDDRGWAMRVNPTWRDEDTEKLVCMLQTVQLQLLGQDRLVLASRLDEAMKTLFVGTNFYVRLARLSSCQNRLKGSFQSVLRSEYEAHQPAYQWVTEHFSEKKRSKVDTAFSKWLKKVKPDVGRFRRAVASFTALSLGDVSRAAKYSEDITLKLNRANNPQIYGYDLAMSYARHASPSDEELLARLDALASKTPTHMFDSVTLAMRFMSASERQSAVRVVRQFSPSLAPQAAAMLMAVAADDLSAALEDELKKQVRVWTLDQVWHAWLAEPREAFGRATVELCAKMADQACLEHVVKRFLSDPLEPASKREYWLNLNSSLGNEQKCAN